MAQLASQLAWGTAIATYGVGDVVTTAYGLSADGVKESHPVAQKILDSGGIVGMAIWKTTTIGLFGLLGGVVPESVSIGVPIGLSILGSVVVGNNLRIIRQARQRR